MRQRTTPPTPEIAVMADQVIARARIGGVGTFKPCDAAAVGRRMASTAGCVGASLSAEYGRRAGDARNRTLRDALVVGADRPSGRERAFRSARGEWAPSVLLTGGPNKRSGRRRIGDDSCAVACRASRRPRWSDHALARDPGAWRSNPAPRIWRAGRRSRRSLDLAGRCIRRESMT